MADPKPLKDAKRDFTREYLASVLAYANGKTGGASRVAGMTVPNFCKLLRLHGLRASDFRSK